MPTCPPPPHEIEDAIKSWPALAPGSDLFPCEVVCSFEWPERKKLEVGALSLSKKTEPSQLPILFGLGLKSTV